MPLAKLDWIRNPGSYTFDAFGTESLGPINILASQANTTVQQAIQLPTSVKIVKIGVVFGALGVVVGTAGFAFNIVYNTVQPPYTGGVYSQATTAPSGAAFGNDNSVTGPLPGGLGVCTNYATNNTSLFATDIAISTANFPSATQANGGANIFVPTFYDAVYPAGPFTDASTGAVNANLASVFTLRTTTPVSGTIANLSVTLFFAPITMRESYQTPGNPQNACVPGIAY